MWSNRENCKDFERSKLSNSISNRSQGMVFHRHPLFQVTLLPDLSGPHQWMSGVTMLVRWLCSFPASELHVKWVCQPSFFPGLRKCTPRQQGHVNQQAAP